MAGAGAGREQKVLRAGEAVRTPVTHSKDTTSLEESEGNVMLWDKLICDRSQPRCEQDAGQDNPEVPSTSPGGSCGISR